MDTDCTCKALGFIKEMVDIQTTLVSLEEKYSEEHPGPVDHALYQREVMKNRDLQRKVRKLAPRIYYHVRDQAEKPGNESLVKPVAQQIENMRKEANILSFDKDTFSLMGYDINIKDVLHKHDEVKQLMACGGPYDGVENMEDGAKVMKIALDIVADPEAMGLTSESDALVLLKQYTDGLGCPVD